MTFLFREEKAAGRSVLHWGGRNNYGSWQTSAYARQVGPRHKTSDLEVQDKCKKSFFSASLLLLDRGSRRPRSVWIRKSGFQCCGSMTFWYGSGSADPCLWQVDPYPDSAIFVIDLQDANKKLFFSSFYAYFFLKIHLNHFSKIKSKKRELKVLLNILTIFAWW